MGAAVCHYGRLSARGKENGERFTEEHRPLGTALQILKSRNRLPTAAQREGDVLAGRDSR